MKTDVLVIGGGAAGMRCAEEAAKCCSVIVIADGYGASPYIHGINVPLHKEDSPELFIQDTMESGHFQNKRELVEVLCRESVHLAEEFEFDKINDKYKLLKPLGASVPRVVEIQGKTGIFVLNGIKKKQSFTRLDSVRAMRLDCRENKVQGAFCFDKQRKKWFYIAAKTVVLACGGFGGIFPFSTNSCDIGGDGIAMAYDAGARLCDMEFIQFEPSVAVYPKSLIGKSIITTMLYEGAVIRNKSGNRFMDECVNKDVLARKIYEEIKNGGGTEHGGVYFDMTGVGKEQLLRRYGDYYKRYADKGIDIAEEPVEIAPGAHTTLGGAEIDCECKTTVGGLFACGEVSGGLHGANRLGGNAGLEVLIFGKIAGKSAAAYAKSLPEPNGSEWEAEEEPYDSTGLRERLNAAVNLGLYVIRNRKDCEHALAEVQEILRETKKRKYSFSAARLYNDAETAYISLVCALKRTQSIGCHIRSDSMEEDKRYTLTAEKKNESVFINRRIL